MIFAANLLGLIFVVLAPTCVVAWAIGKESVQ